MCRPHAARSVLVFVAIVVTGATCRTGSETSRAIVPVHALKVVDLKYMDTTVKACTDFFQFAVGGWIDRDTIPAAYSSSGVSKEMTDNSEGVLHSVLDDVMARRASIPADSTTHKLGTYYATCMDSTGIEAAGLTPLQPMLASIDRIASQSDLLQQIGALHMNGADVVFQYGPSPDPHDAAHYMAWLQQGGLGLPDRDYYTKTDAKSDSTRTFYIAHVARMFALAGAPQADADRDAASVLALETELAKVSLTRQALRDPAAVDHPMTAAQLRTLAPKVEWNDYFRTVGLTAPTERFNVAEPAFVKRVSTLLDSVPLTVWRPYLRYHLLSTAGSSMSTPFVNENFKFSSYFSGAKELLPRWKRCLRSADRRIGEALGQAYVELTFPPEARDRARAVIEDVRAAFRDRVQKLDWMSDTTKTKALAKLDKMGRKVGYPDKWRDYSTLVVEDGPFVLNELRANAFEWQRVVNRPGQPVDLTEWFMTVPTVNAYYDPTKNEMVFPAGALIPQTFDPNADDGANYGSLGASWAGHELTHGFDDEGRHFDAAGNLTDWWLPSDSLKFVKQADLIAKQFSGYIQVDTTHVNGKLTLGENIADLGGVLVGYDALQRALARSGRRDTVEGFTPEQRFFIAYAQSWRTHVRDEQLKTRVTVDPHAPERWRTNGPLSNIPAFAQAFGCKPGDPMVRDPATVGRIW
jgi:putative endopeptidase